MQSEPNNQAEVVAAEGLIATLVPSSTEECPKVMLDIAPAAIFKIVFTIAAIWLVIAIFPVLILIVLSLMLVATLNPLVRRLQTRLGRRWALFGVTILLVAIPLGALAILVPVWFSQAEMLYKNAPQYAAQIETALAHDHIRVNLQKQVTDWMGKSGDLGPQWMSLFSSVVEVVTGFVTVGILTIYLLIEGPETATSILRLLPRSERLPARRLFSEIGAQVGGYMRGQLITSCLAGAFVFLLLLVLQVPGAMALAALAAVADAIPLIGLLVALVPAAMMALTISPAKAITVVVVYLIYHQLEDHFIAPKVYGTALGLSLSVIVISILIGVQLMGMMGALLAIPAAAAVPAVVAFIQAWQETHSAPEATD